MASRSYPLPLYRAIVGTSVFCQAFVIDPPANTAGLIATNAVEATIGG